jgi:hypothetical protein
MTPEQHEYLRLRKACADTEHEIQQILGKALGYPWFKDDLKNWPDATEEDGVCVGEHVAVTLAMEAAEKIKDLERRLTFIIEQVKLLDNGLEKMQRCK